MAGCLTTPEIDVRLKELGVKDSKLILPNKREQLFEEVKNLVLDYEIIIESPKEIDSALNNPDLNLNKLEGLTSLKIIAAVYKRQGKSFEAMLDSPSNNPQGYLDYLGTLMNNDKIKIKAEIKADMNHINVGAASILAKVTRDRLVKELQEKAKEILGHEVNIGSGYPADPYTKKFLEENWDKLDSIEGGFFRKTWKTYQNIAKSKSQKGLADF